MQMKKVAMIMAGGQGKRFWPVSTKEKPKHLQNIISQDSMLNDTISRIKKIIDIKDIYIMTNKISYQYIIENIDKEFDKENIIVEPVSKKTAPCIIYFTNFIKQKYDEVTILVLPSDHYIDEVNNYYKNINQAFLKADNYGIVTIGIKPDRPDTGYGYILYKNNKVEQFIEKPSYEQAIQYLKEGNYYFNSGMFVFKAKTLLNIAKRLSADIYNDLVNNSIEYGYKYCRSASFDYEIMERADTIYMIKSQFIWSDIGSWDRVYDLEKKDINNNYSNGRLIAIDSINSYIQTSKKNVAIIGINDIIVVETKDNLLICKKDQAQKVKYIVDAIEKRRQ